MISWEWDSFADVMESTNPSHESLEPETKTRSGHTTIFTSVEIPLIVSQIISLVDDFLFEGFVVTDTF